MEGDRFDDLTRALGNGTTRRRVIRTLAAGTAAAIATVFGRGSVDAAPMPRACKVGCAGFNRQRKVACEKACKECGGNFDQVCTTEDQFGPSAFTCCLEGTFCVSGEGVCCEAGTNPCFVPDGFTACCPAGTFCDFDTGECPAVALCPSGEPAENCAAGIELSCGDTGQCAQVINVDGGCTCVERACSFIPCTTGADCETGLCVDIPGCCGEPNLFCGFPCGTEVITAQSTWG